MADTVFRTKQEAPAEKKNENIVDENLVTTGIVHEEVPYTHYLEETGRPYLAEIYGLGDHWEIFGSELDAIGGYISDKIASGEIANSTKAVRGLIKKMEKINNIKDEERSVVRLGILSSYINFLEETDGIKLNVAKYGNTK